MKFFDQLTVSALLSRLKIAGQHCPHPIAWMNVSAAYKKFRKIRERQIQGMLNSEEWNQVGRLSSMMAMEALSGTDMKAIQAGFELTEITEFAGKWRDEAFKRELGRSTSN